MPRTAATIASAVRSNKRPENLFPRIPTSTQEWYVRHVSMITY